MPRTHRRHRILERLRHGPVASQEQLVEELAATGELVTQATVSRDLRALGVVKGPEGYRLPVDPARGNGHGATENGHALDRALRHQVLDILPAESLVVLRTPAGFANAVATVFDDAPPRGMLGSIAGDDTIFIACSSRSAARDLAGRLRRRRDRRGKRGRESFATGKDERS